MLVLMYEGLKGLCMIRYQVLFGKISKVEIEKETETYIFLPGGSMDNKRSSWRNYFGTWQEAKSFLLEELWAKVEQATDEQELLFAEFKKVVALREEDTVKTGVFSGK
jgi:hypothetical protein